jgi:hypothetical protein
VFSAQIFQENTFLKTKPNFPLAGKCFPLTNFSNGKQTQESLKSDSRKPLSGKQTQPKGKYFPGNQTKFFFDWKVFPADRKVFFIDRKVFSVDQLF